MDDRIYYHRSNAKGKCMRNLRSEGNAGERIAGLFLEQHGVRILERNFRSGRQGEIDLIGFEQDTLVFFEVKLRRSERCGTPEAAVTYSKQKTICRTADYYRFLHRISENCPIRFDVVAIRRSGANGAAVHWIRNAFPYHR